MKVGEVIVGTGNIELNAGREYKTILVSNFGDRPIQVGSHYHFFEVNKLLGFDRSETYGFRLDIPSGTSVRFEPGEEKSVQLVMIGGTKRVFGLNDLTCGQVSDYTKDEAMQSATLKGFVK